MYHWLASQISPYIRIKLIDPFIYHWLNHVKPFVWSVEKNWENYHLSIFLKIEPHDKRHHPLPTVERKTSCIFCSYICVTQAKVNEYWVWKSRHYNVLKEFPQTFSMYYTGQYFGVTITKKRRRDDSLLFSYSQHYVDSCKCVYVACYST